MRHPLVVACVGMLSVIGGCRPSDVLDVPAPAGVVPNSAVQNQAGAESVFNTARFTAFKSMVGIPNIGGSPTGGTAPGGGVLEWSSVLTDEFRWATWLFDNYQGNVDARVTTGTVFGFRESGDEGIQSLLAADRLLALSIPGLRQYEPAAGRAKIGEAFALAGYTELLMAEDYCAGVPLSRIVPGSGFVYGAPLTTDSLLGEAEAKFDSALANTFGDPTVKGLASVGLGRARLDRGHFTASASAVAGVATGFIYNTQLPPLYGDGGVKASNIYSYLLNRRTLLATIYFNAYNEPFINMSDREGGTGLNFVSAGDPRLVVDSSLGPTPDGTTWYFPKKFEADLSSVPLATGIEARLIQAEAALRSGSAGTWASDLDALRADSADTHVAVVPPLTPDSTTTATPDERVDVMFRERAFWLFGTGTRLGDLRRLMRQYGRSANTVFPSGTYVTDASVPPGGNYAPPANYGTDVSLTLPTPAGGQPFGFTTGNPNYRGCLDRNP